MYFIFQATPKMIQFHISGHPHAGQRRSGARMPQPIAAILSILTILQYGENDDIIMMIGKYETMSIQLPLG